MSIRNGKMNENHNITLIENMHQATIDLEGLTCATCVGSVKSAISALDGVYSCNVTLLPSEKAVVQYDPATATADKVIQAVLDVGFGASLNEDKSLNDKSLTSKLTLKILSSTNSTAIAMNEINEINNRALQIHGVKEVRILNDVVEITYDSKICVGPRSIIDILSTVAIVELMDYIEDMNKHIKGSSVKELEKKRQDNIQWKLKKLLFTLSFSFPILILSMIIGMAVPKEQVEDIHNIIFGDVTLLDFILFLLATPVQFISGALFYKDSYTSIMKKKKLGMPFLIMLGSSAAYFYSIFAMIFNSLEKPNPPLSLQFEVSSLLITFVLLGNYLEVRAKAKTSEALVQLASLAPSSAILLDENDQEKEISLILVQRNDILKVKPGEKIPVDCEIIFGESHVDESMLTGESIPNKRVVGSKLFAGTINVDGVIKVKVTGVGQETALSQIVKLVEEAQSSTAPIQRYADKISSNFVVIVLLLSLLTFVIWIIVLKVQSTQSTINEWPHRKQGVNDYVFAFLFAISVLVIACPCALGLATPTAIMVGTGVGARIGILIKGGEPLESAQHITTVVFDKTGTLTHGKMFVTDMFLMQNLTPREKSTTLIEATKEMKKYVLYLSASAERGSEHPLGKAIVKKVDDEIKLSYNSSIQTPILPESFKTIPGLGIQCVIDGHVIQIGNRSCMIENGVNVDFNEMDQAMTYLQKQGKSAIIVAIDEVVEAIFGLQDTPKDDASSTINQLHKMKINVYMLTGDNTETANVIANMIGIPSENVIAGVIPSQKAKMILKLKEKGGEKEGVSMVGDGINDSAALAVSNLGIAIGAGADIAIEAAGMVLINSRLRNVVVALDLSKQIYRRIRLNFFYAFIYNCLGIPIAAGILYPWLQIALPPWLASAAMAFSSVSVVLSSLMLSTYKPPSNVLNAKVDDKYQAIYENKENMDNINGDIGHSLLKDTFVSGCASQWESLCRCGDGCECKVKCNRLINEVHID